MRSKESTAQPPLFGSPSAWIEEPRTAWESWLISGEYSHGSRRPPGRPATEALAKSSSKVYQAMSASFLSYLDDRKRGMHEATEQDIERFFRGLTATSTIRIRYLRLLERTYEHLVQIGVTKGNPVSVAAAAHRVNLGRDRAMEFLDPVQARALQEHLGALVQEAVETENTTVLRDACLVSLAIGAGLTVQELRGVRWSDVDSLDSGGRFVRIHGAGGRQHRTRWLKPWVGIWDTWVSWDQVHDGQAARNPGSRVFSAGSAAGVDAATVHRAVTRSCEGLEFDKPCARTLRNTFALGVLEEFGEAVATEYLGHGSSEAMLRYRRALERAQASREPASRVNRLLRPRA